MSKWTTIEEMKGKVCEYTYMVGTTVWPLSSAFASKAKPNILTDLIKIICKEYGHVKESMAQNEIEQKRQ